MIDFEDVIKAYPNGTHALNGINLHIDDGEFVFIVGQSGAGKSTLMKLLLREEMLSSGKLIVNGHDLSRLSVSQVPFYRRELGVVFQDFRLFPKKTVYENVAFAMQVIGTPPRLVRPRVLALLRTVGLEGKVKRFPNQLSGGEAQRVVLARALANNPKIILADEPTGNLDPQRSRGIMDLLLRINNLNKTVIVVTHEQDLVKSYLETNDVRAIVLDSGRIIGEKKKGQVP